MRLKFITALLLFITGCTQYRLVEVQSGMNVNINAIQKEIGFNSPSEIINGVRPCGQEDANRFEIEVKDFKSCIIVKTQTLASCPTEYERLIIKGQASYMVTEPQLVTICLH